MVAAMVALKVALLAWKLAVNLVYLKAVMKG